MVSVTVAFTILGGIGGFARHGVVLDYFYLVVEGCGYGKVFGYADACERVGDFAVGVMPKRRFLYADDVVGDERVNYVVFPEGHVYYRFKPFADFYVREFVVQKRAIAYIRYVVRYDKAG
jgi:hypothetical protein